MSTRTHICSVSSIEPLRDSVASCDSTLLNAVLQHYTNDLRIRYDGEDPDDGELTEFREMLEEMICIETPPAIEPGSWIYVFDTLADHFGLQRQDDYPLNEDWKHNYVWESYRGMLAGIVSRESDASLSYIQTGRPLRGSKVENDGCVFAWLDSEEVSSLHDSLASLEMSAITDPELVEFHIALVSSLEKIKERDGNLLVQAQ